MLYLQPIYEMQKIKWPVTSASVSTDTTRSQPTVWSTPGSTAVQSSAALSSNLSELDNLLQELSSAQFAVEVDRRSTGLVWHCCYISCRNQISAFCNYGLILTIAVTIIFCVSYCFLSLLSSRILF